MANKVYSVKKASQKTLNALEELGRGLKKTVKRSVQEVGEGAYNVARATMLKNKEHTQKYGSYLYDQIGINYSDNTVSIYAPKNNTEEMSAHMYFAEHGTGYTSSGWWYKTTPHDHNQRKKIVKQTGDLIAFTKESVPVGYMKAARRYLVANSRRRAVENIRLYITRKPYKYYSRGEEGEE